MAEILSLEGYAFKDEKAHERLDTLDKSLSAAQKKINIIESSNHYITPQMFGAVGDGVTDDTVAFQAAIDRCSDINGDIGVVYIPQGNYLVNSLYIRKHRGISIIGERTEFDPDRTTNLIYNGDGYCINIEPDDFPFIYGCEFKNFDIRFKCDCLGAYNIKNLEESVFENIGVYSYRGHVVQSAFNINGLTISTLRNINVNGCVVAFNLAENGTGENKRSLGTVNLCESNIFNNDVNFLLADGVSSFHIYNNWFEGFKSCFKVADRYLAGANICIYNNTFLHSIADDDGIVFDFAKTGEGTVLFNMEVSNNYFTNSAGNDAKCLINSGETWIYGNFRGNCFSGYGETICIDNGRNSLITGTYNKFMTTMDGFSRSHSRLFEGSFETPLKKIAMEKSFTVDVGSKDRMLLTVKATSSGVWGIPLLINGESIVTVTGENIGEINIEFLITGDGKLIHGGTVYEFSNPGYMNFMIYGEYYVTYGYMTLEKL